jgi:3-oxoacyl-[acyl-carrier-protein] synthase III
MHTNSVIVATGKYLPEVEIRNEDFLTHPDYKDKEFYLKDGKKDPKTKEARIKKFQERTGIKSRRYARPDQVASDLGALALQHALDSSGIDISTIDCFIGATNFFDVPHLGHPPETVANLATRILHKTPAYQRLTNPSELDISAMDVAYGCPGWVEGMILADMRIKLGISKRVAVIAAETLSRISDPHDYDSMIYADGAGVAILEARTSNNEEGIIAHKSRTIPFYKAKGEYGSVTDTAQYLTMGPSNNPQYPQDKRFLKMLGPNVAQLALDYVPAMIVDLLKKKKISQELVNFFLLHQAQEQLDHDMARKAGVPEAELEHKVPINIYEYGNSSVGTVPIMFDMIMRNELKSNNGYLYAIHPGNVIVVASIGGSMHANAFIYVVPNLNPFPDMLFKGTDRRTMRQGYI